MDVVALFRSPIPAPYFCWPSLDPSTDARRDSGTIWNHDLSQIGPSHRRVLWRTRTWPGPGFPLVFAWLLGVLALVTHPHAANAQAIDLPAELAEQESQEIERIAQIIRPTVCVHSADGSGGGSGVLISESGLALTNYHVVQPCGSYMQCTLSDGNVYDAVIVGIDPTGDVAMIQLLGRQDFPVATLGDSDQVKIGDTCYAVGNPFLLATNRQPTVSRGIISGTHRYQEPAGTLLEYTDCLQIDAAVNPGNSGGPLFDAAGQLIGINGRCSFEKRSRINVGVAYAISINQIKLFLGALESGRVTDHASLGAILGSGPDGSIRVTEILEDSDAADCGLKPGDEVLEFGGRPLSTVNQFKNQLGIYPNRWYVPIVFRHDGQVVRKHVRLEPLHDPRELQPTALPFRPTPQPSPVQTPGDDSPDRLSPDLNQKTPVIPEPARQKIDFRPGFVNFHYNQLQLQRVLQSSSAENTGQSITAESISFRGQDRDRGALRLEVGELQAGFLSDLETRITGWPEATADTEVDRDAASVIDDVSRQHSDRHLMLYGLMAWRRWTRQQAKGFPLVFYVGTYPTRYSEELHDVVLTSFADLQVELYFRADGKVDTIMCHQFGVRRRCEIRLEQWQATAQGPLPHQIEAYFAGETFLQLQVEQVKLGRVANE